MASGGTGYAQDFEKGVKAYESGDYATALRELRPLAKQGNASIQNNLGFMHEKGQGVLEDNIYAHMRFNIAALNGDVRPVKGRELMAKLIPSADILKAQALARETVKKNYKGC